MTAMNMGVLHAKAAQNIRTPPVQPVAKLIQLGIIQRDAMQMAMHVLDKHNVQVQRIVPEVFNIIARQGIQITLVMVKNM